MTISSALKSNFIRQQQNYLFLAVVVIAVFWAIGQQINPLTIVLYSLLIGNFVSVPLDTTRGLYTDRRFPYDWLFYIGLLFLFMVPAYIMTTVAVVKLAPPAPGVTIRHLLVNGWRFPVLVTLVYGIVNFVTRRSRARLEQRNQELQRAVQVSSAQIEVQEQELQRAQEIQQALLPKQVPQVAGFDIAGLWQPARMVGGDYYDVVRLSEHRLGMCIGDVVGKGVSAALLMANVQAAVRAFVFSAESPAWLCTRLNQVLCDNIAEGKFVTFFYGVLDAERNTFEYCNAGHLPPLVLNARSVTSLDQGGTVLGIFPASKYECGHVRFGTNDSLILFTDGVTEATAADGEEFGEVRVAEFARSANERVARALNERLLAKVSAFCDGQFADDATLLTLVRQDS